MNSSATPSATLQAVQIARRHAADPVVRRAGFVLLAATVPFFVLWPTLASLAAAWSDPLRVELSHGYLTALVAMWLIWFRRNEIAQAPAQAQTLALPVLALLSIAWLVVQRSGIQVGHQMLLPLISIATVYAVCGWAVTKRTLFPIGFLFLAMPVWTVLNGPLQWGSVLAVRALLRLADIPVYFSGTRFEIPAGVFEIAGGCSGLRLMVAGLAIATLYGELHRESLVRRVLLVLLGALLAASANWLRIVIIITAGHIYGMDHLLVKDHIWFGWLVFACAMVVFFWLANRMLVSQRANEQRSDAMPAAHELGVWRVSVTWCLVALGALALGPVWSLAQVGMQRLDVQTEFVAPRVDGWHEEKSQSDWQPVFKGADWQAQLNYFPNTVAPAGVADSRIGVELFSASYRVQQQGKELTGYGNTIFGVDEFGLQRVLQSTLEVRNGVPTVATLVQTPNEQWLYWHSYAVGNAWLANPLRAQLRYALVSLTTFPETRVLIVRTRCGERCDLAAERLLPVWQAAVF